MLQLDCQFELTKAGHRQPCSSQTVGPAHQTIFALMPDLRSRLAFILEAEKLKNVLRSAHTSSGRKESTAEHSWRLCLLAMTLEDILGPLDFERILKLCVIHDLGEAINGDVSAVLQQDLAPKSAQERQDFQKLTETLPESLQAEFLSLWDDYEYARTHEARIVKALDKIETIVQHNQGQNPADFDYAFNLQYGRKYLAEHPVIAELRAMVDQATRLNAGTGQFPAPGRIA